MMTNIIIIIIILFATIFQIPCVDYGGGEEKAANNTFPHRINIKPLPPKNDIQKENWKLRLLYTLYFMIYTLLYTL